MIDYSFDETNTEIVLTFTGDTNEIILKLSGGDPLDLGLSVEHGELDGLLDMIDERYDYQPTSNDPDDWKWLKVVINNGIIYFEHTFTELSEYSHVVRIRGVYA
jgi:hypothetical protein